MIIISFSMDPEALRLTATRRSLRDPMIFKDRKMTHKVSEHFLESDMFVCIKEADMTECRRISFQDHWRIEKVIITNKRLVYWNRPKCLRDITIHKKITAYNVFNNIEHLPALEHIRITKHFRRGLIESNCGDNCITCLCNIVPFVCLLCLSLIMLPIFIVLQFYSEKVAEHMKEILGILSICLAISIFCATWCSLRTSSIIDKRKKRLDKILDKVTLLDP